ncbi:MAG: enoyl-CoA hydratase/isomerase family protein [Pseudomonadales bacterium]
MSVVATPNNTDSVTWVVENATVFRLARPDKLNAISRSVLTALARCLDDMERQGSRLLVITGEGNRAFSAGADLDELRHADAYSMTVQAAIARELFLRLSRSKVLSIAAINGVAFGGGLELAMACTLRIAAPHARVSLPEIKLGLMPAYGGTQFLPALVGSGRALEMMLTGRVLSAAEAASAGLISRICLDGEDVLQAALNLGAEVTGRSASSIRGIRACVDAYMGRHTGVDFSAEGFAVREVFRSEQARQGVAGFFAK